MASGIDIDNIISLGNYPSVNNENFTVEEISIEMETILTEIRKKSVLNN